MSELGVNQEAVQRNQVAKKPVEAKIDSVPINGNRASVLKERARQVELSARKGLQEVRAKLAQRTDALKEPKKLLPTVAHAAKTVASIVVGPGDDVAALGMSVLHSANGQAEVRTAADINYESEKHGRLVITGPQTTISAGPPKDQSLRVYEKNLPNKDKVEKSALISRKRVLPPQTLGRSIPQSSAPLNVPQVSRAVEQRRA